MNNKWLRYGGHSCFIGADEAVQCQVAVGKVLAEFDADKKAAKEAAAAKEQLEFQRKFEQQQWGQQQWARLPALAKFPPGTKVSYQATDRYGDLGKPVTGIVTAPGNIPAWSLKEAGLTDRVWAFWDTDRHLGWMPSDLVTREPVANVGF